MAPLENPGISMLSGKGGDGESSVESAIPYSGLNGHHESIPCLEDISVTSRGADSYSRSGYVPRTGSAHSLFSTESPFEMALRGPDDGCLQSDRKFPTTDSHETCLQPSHQGRMFTVPNFTDLIVKVKESSSSEAFLRRDNTSSESLSSVKDHLSFGSVPENCDYDSLASSDQDSDSEEEQLITARKTNRFNVSKIGSNSAPEEPQSDAKSSVDDSVINRILGKKDSKELIQKAKKATHTTTYSVRAKKVTGKAKSITSDPLLDRFLISARRSPASRLGPVRRHEAFDTVGPAEQHRVIKAREMAFHTIIKKSDSLNHVSKEGRRLVKTRQDSRHELKTTASKGRRGSHRGSTEVLMDRFLASKVEQRQYDEQRPDCTGNNQTLSSCDSLNRVDGKGQRLVGTRPY